MNLTGATFLQCPICDARSDNRFEIPDCEHYEYDDTYDEYLPYVDCAGCGKHKLFNLRTPDYEGGQYFCSMTCRKAALEPSLRERAAEARKVFGVQTLIKINGDIVDAESGDMLRKHQAGDRG